MKQRPSDPQAHTGNRRCAKNKENKYKHCRSIQTAMKPQLLTRSQHKPGKRRQPGSLQHGGKLGKDRCQKKNGTAYGNEQKNQRIRHSGPNLSRQFFLTAVIGCQTVQYLIQTATGLTGLYHVYKKVRKNPFRCLHGFRQRAAFINRLADPQKHLLHPFVSLRPNAHRQNIPQRHSRRHHGTELPAQGREHSDFERRQTAGTGLLYFPPPETVKLPLF